MRAGPILAFLGRCANIKKRDREISERQRTELYRRYGGQAWRLLLSVSESWFFSARGQWQREPDDVLGIVKRRHQECC